MAFYHPLTQGSEAWLLMRAGKPTASEFDRLVAPTTWKVRTGEGPQTFLCEKIAELYCGIPQDQSGSWAMMQGTVGEDEARGWYEFETGNTVKPGGFVTDDAWKYGASPDGLIGDDGGLELKRPQPATHAKWLLAGVLPSDHAAQVQGCLFVTGRKWWDFVSYCRNLPPLVVRVEPDPKAQAAIGEALTLFLARMDGAIAKIDAMQPEKVRAKLAANEAFAKSTMAP